MEKQLKREEIYNGKVISVVKDEVSIDNGRTSIREVVIHNGGACIAIKNGNKFFLVSQYRYAQGAQLLEFPAGKIEKGESPDETILREAQEETGYSVKNLKYFGYIVPTGGYSSEKIYLYYGEADQKVGQHFDTDENLSLKAYTFAELQQLVKDKVIVDGKTIALMYFLKMEGLDD